MANGKSSAGFWVLISTLVVGGGIGIYFFLRKPKSQDGKSEDGKSEEEKKAELEKPKDDVPSTSSSSSSSSSSNNYVAPQSFTFPFTTEAEGNTFRAFVIEKYPTYAKSIDLGATGKLNSYVQKAWDKYGAEYSKTLAFTPAYQQGTTVNYTQLKNIDKILGFATGRLATKTYLSQTNPSFVNTWANAVTNNKRTFIWANQVYRTKTGDKVLEYNPIGVKHYAKITGTIKMDASDDSIGLPMVKGISLGTAKAVDYNNGLWLFLPDKSLAFYGAKWVKASSLTKVKPTSIIGFSGGEEEIWAGFDNNFDITFK